MGLDGNVLRGEVAMNLLLLHGVDVVGGGVLKLGADL